MTLPRLAFQIFEKQIRELSVEDKENFPICKYRPSSDMYRGIFSSVDEFKKYKNTLEYLTYKYDNGRQFVIYCWNLFSTLLFVQECLKRFGNEGDQFVLIYREKEKKEEDRVEDQPDIPDQRPQTLRNPYSSMLLSSKNLIFRGAPGTGKSYLAREIAADIISNGYFDDYTMLSEDQKQQVELVQFHPSYDYSDFVEGLRPKIHLDGSMGFELRDGIFKTFIGRARKNFEDSQKPAEAVLRELQAREAMDHFLSEVEPGKDKFRTVKGSEFFITGFDEQYIEISIPRNESVNTLRLRIDEICSMLESEKTFKQVSDLTAFFGIRNTQQKFSYELALYLKIQKRMKQTRAPMGRTEELKPYIFIIDEINRGEISKIFGELFYSIDPGYRGRSGEISTQYSNLHSDPDEKFYIPDNVYIIGTMNDIDRSVDTFDFAMRRRFRFVELRADARLEMLSLLEDEELQAEAIQRMAALNKEIASIEDLNENYQIGASYFLKLKTLDFDQLWTDYLQPLLQEYVHGLYGEETIMSRFAKAYGYRQSALRDDDEDDQDQR